MKASVRFQTLYEGVYNRDNKTWADKLLIRRSRLKFDGYAFSPRLKYKVELGLSNRDHGGEIDETNNTSNLVMDAVIMWNFAGNWELWAGQTKLPGNRERVISSQKLQFVDRSLVNSRFNIDRDIGIQLRNKSSIGSVKVNTMFSISMGEGRNITANNTGGYDYTARVEFLPLGSFTSKGDYFGSDLSREPSPKLSVGITYDYNDGASRQRGQLGSYIEDISGTRINTDLSTIFADIMFKYKGIQYMSEFADKNNVNENFGALGGGNFAGFYSGTGMAHQLGYLFANNWEIAGRYTRIKPDDISYSSLPDETEWTLGVNKYIVGHSLKVQSDFSVRDRVGSSSVFQFRLQMELSF